jgi:hypothetical protein
VTLLKDFVEHFTPLSTLFRGHSRFLDCPADKLLTLPAGSRRDCRVNVEVSELTVETHDEVGGVLDQREKVVTGLIEQRLHLPTLNVIFTQEEPERG